MFFARGWEAVTIGDVLDEAGISKGGFYHHFTAKEDLFDAVVQRLTEQALASADAVHAASTGNALERFNAFIGAMNRWKADRGAEMRFYAEVILRPGNDFLFQRVAAASAEAVQPVLREMIAEGIAEGSFDVPDENLAAETILALGHGRREILQRAIRLAETEALDEATQLLVARMDAEGRLIDRLLGLTPGSIRLSDPGGYRQMMIAMVGRQEA